MKLEELKQLVAQLMPHQAAALEQAIAEVEAGERDLASIDVAIRYRLEKFDGEYHPGKQPVEVIEGTD